jgi:hypothetical protein
MMDGTRLHLRGFRLSASGLHSPSDLRPQTSDFSKPNVSKSRKNSGAVGSVGNRGASLRKQKVRSLKFVRKLKAGSRKPKLLLRREVPLARPHLQILLE